MLIILRVIILVYKSTWFACLHWKPTNIKQIYSKKWRWCSWIILLLRSQGYKLLFVSVEEEEHHHMKALKSAVWAQISSQSFFVVTDIFQATLQWRNAQNQWISSSVNRLLFLCTSACAGLRLWVIYE